LREKKTLDASFFLSFLSLPMNLNSEQAIMERVDDNVRKVELRSDCGGLIVTTMLTPDDIHNIVANMLFLNMIKCQRKNNVKMIE
jgi:hypothetical protein